MKVQSGKLKVMNTAKDIRTVNQNRKLWWLINELGLRESVSDLVSDETN